MEEFRGEIGGDKERIKLGLDSAVAEHQTKTLGDSKKEMSTASVMIRFMLMMVWRKLTMREPQPPTSSSSVMALLLPLPILPLYL